MATAAFALNVAPVLRTYLLWIWLSDDSRCVHLRRVHPHIPCTDGGSLIPWASKRYGSARVLQMVRPRAANQARTGAGAIGERSMSSAFMPIPLGALPSSAPASSSAMDAAEWPRLSARSIGRQPNGVASLNRAPDFAARPPRSL